MIRIFYISFPRSNSIIVSLFDFEKTNKDVATQMMMITMNINKVFIIGKANGDSFCRFRKI
ncbi:hypothetical protein D3Z38_12055 [Clostridiales bacterium]|nr:hypothetical protein [Clostridiales bacterium]